MNKKKTITVLVVVMFVGAILIGNSYAFRRRSGGRLSGGVNNATWAISEKTYDYHNRTINYEELAKSASWYWSKIDATMSSDVDVNFKQIDDIESAQVRFIPAVFRGVHWESAVICYDKDDRPVDFSQDSSDWEYGKCYLNVNLMNRDEYDSFYRQSVVVHGMGHVLGLADIYDYEKVAMYQRTGKNRTAAPTADDIKGVRDIYED